MADQDFEKWGWIWELGANQQGSMAEPLNEAGWLCQKSRFAGVEVFAPAKRGLLAEIFPPAKRGLLAQPLEAEQLFLLDLLSYMPPNIHTFSCNLARVAPVPHTKDAATRSVS